jgi:PIN domain nuclease of toxin-antitoxin system
MILLDTCALIWSLFESDRLSASAEQALRENDRAVSIASLWEMSIKISLGKLHLSKTITEISRLCEESGIDILPITPEDCEMIQSLPLMHKDPFDRIIMAQSIRKEAGIITDDEKIRKYDMIKTIW